MNWEIVYGLLAHALIFGAVGAILPLGAFRGRAALAATTLALLVGIAPTLHAVFGLPSLTLLCCALLRHAQRDLAEESTLGMLLVLLAGGVLYLNEWTGWGGDLYALGYAGPVLLASLLPLGLTLAWQGYSRLLLILAMDLLGYGSGLFQNLWDALLDPLLFGVCSIVLLRQLLLPRVLLLFSAKPPR